MKVENLKIEKVKVRDDLYLIAVTDKKDRIFAAGAFDYQAEAETAANIIHTLLVKLKTLQKASPLKLDDFVRMMSAPAQA